ncbi:uncharacterized protein LOC134775955 isoform X2 [Penaeus indicus]|uniref:uncharacterized protein LOC134775955 isoform X2 n=1 Tax=Penaeus indicus TaxID=29960 RepID=UPI00300DB3E3
MRYLRNRRAHHTNIVKAEFCEEEVAWRSYYNAKGKINRKATVLEAELEEVEVVRRSYHNAKAKSNRKAQILEAPCTATSPSPMSSEDEQSGEDNAEEPEGKQGEGTSATEEKPDACLAGDLPEDKGVSEACERVEKLDLEEGEPETVTERL